MVSLTTNSGAETGPEFGADGVKDSDRAIYQYILEMGDSFVEFPGKGGIRPAGKAHGPKITISVNDVAFESIKKGENPLRDGSLILLRTYRENGNLHVYSVMYKIKGYHPKFHDWYYAGWLADGTPIVLGLYAWVGEGNKKLIKEGSGCLGSCHLRMKESDFIFSGVK